MKRESAFLVTAAMLSLAAAWILPSIAHAQLLQEKPRSIVLIIADGLGPNMQEALRLLDGALAVDSMPASALVRTSSANDVVTDSAAAATAMATGKKTANYRIGIDAEGKPATTLAEIAKARGMAIGLVTTSYVLDATPAAFASHAGSRSHTDSISLQMLKLAPELIYGNGAAYFIPPPESAPSGKGRRKDGQNLLKAFAARGYSLPTAPTLGPLPQLGLFDGKANTKKTGLAKMARTALSNLEQTGKPFFLLIEEEDTDTAAHDADVAGAVEAARSWNEAVQAVLEYQKRNPEVAVIVTADHETGGVMLQKPRACSFWRRIVDFPYFRRAALLSDKDERPFCLRIHTQSHTAAPVMIYASGVDLPGTIIDNTQIYEILRNLVGRIELP